MKTIKEVIAVLTDKIELSCDDHIIACLKRAKQIVKASKKYALPRKGK